MFHGKIHYKWWFSIAMFSKLPDVHRDPTAFWGEPTLGGWCLEAPVGEACGRAQRKAPNRPDFPAVLEVVFLVKHGIIMGHLPALKVDMSDMREFIGIKTSSKLVCRLENQPKNFFAYRVAAALFQLWAYVHGRYCWSSHLLHSLLADVSDLPVDTMKDIKEGHSYPSDPRGSSGFEALNMYPTLGWVWVSFWDPVPMFF